MRILITASLCFLCLGWQSVSSGAILVLSPSGGSPTIKATLAAAATDADAAGKTVIVTSALSAVQSNISSATLHAWPADRTLKREKGGTINNTTLFRFADGATVDFPTDAPVFTGTGAVRGLQEVTPGWWGARGNTAPPYDTAAVQAAFDSGSNVKFSQNYVVDNVNISGIEQTIRFNGFSLIAGSNYGASYVLAITGRLLKLYDVKVDQGFKNYTQAVRWYSVDASHPAMYNKIYGMHISNATYGLVYGATPGTAPGAAALSENTIYSLTVRAVQFPFAGNSGVNGYLTLVSPILDCNPNEWSSQTGYNVTTWQTAAIALTNLTGNLMVFGGEVLKTSSQLGYGMKGKNVVLSGVTLEIMCTQAYLLGNFVIRDTADGYMAGDAVSAFVIDAAADNDVVGLGAKLTLDNCKLRRGAGVAVYSGAKFISGNSTTYSVEIRDSELWEWYSYNLIDSGTTAVKVMTHNLRFPTGATTNPTSTNRGVNVASAATISALDPIFHVTGTVAINVITPPYPQFSGYITIIPDGVFTTTTIGNIAIASTAVVGKALVMVYDATTAKWYPSY